MPSLYYAITIDTNITGVNAPAIGLTSDGFLRYITDRPDYDGNPIYPLWEDTSNNEEIWYEGFLIKDSLSTPNRRIDIEKGGTYGTVSGFTFSLQNSLQLWRLLQNLGISLINANIKLYCVISNTFFATWSGIIDNDPYNETSAKIKCVSNYRKIHKTLPPQQMSNVMFPLADKSSFGKTIPVSLGRIPYARLYNTTGKSTQVVLDYASGLSHAGDDSVKPEDFIYVAGCDSIHGAGVRFNLVSWRKLFVRLELTGSYISPVSGKDADTDQLVRITGNDASIPFYLGGFITVLWLAEPLGVDTTIFNDNYTYDRSLKDAVEDTWWFEIIDAQSKHLISQKDVIGFKFNEFNLPQLYNFNLEKTLMEDVHGLITAFTQTQNRDYIHLLSTTIDKSGAVIYLVPYGCKFEMMDYASTVILSNILPLVDKENATDNNNWSETGPINNGLALTATSSPTNPSVLSDNQFYLDLTNFDLRESEEIYIGIDLSMVVDSIVESKEIGMGLEFVFLDVYEFTHELFPVNMGVQYTYEQTVENPGGDPANVDFNFLPEEYYKNGYYQEFGNPSIYGEIDNDGNAVKDYLKLPDDLKDMIKKNAVKAVLVRIKLSTTATVTISDIVLRQIGVFSLERTETGNNALFIKVDGEIRDSGEIPIGTASVYDSFVHMLENYDNISPDDIVYNNLGYTRSLAEGWEIGRQIESQKASLKYLQDLAQYSFVGIFNSRSGQIELKAFLEDQIITQAFTAQNIVRDSIKDFKKTSILNCYNEFKLQYAFNPGSKKFDRALGITNVHENSFPPYLMSTDGAETEITSPTIFKIIANGDGSGQIIFVSDITAQFSVGDYITYYVEYGSSTVTSDNYIYFARVTSVLTVSFTYADAIINHHTSIVDVITYAKLYKHPGGTPSWMTFVEGLDAYALCKQLWEKCHSAYLQTKIVKNAPSNITKGLWFIDPSVYYNLPSSVCPINSAPYMYLQNMVEWSTRQKNIVNISVPINLATITSELLDFISFSDAIYTNNEVLEGWITKISLNMKKDELDIELILLPSEYETFNRIIETGNAPDTITESGSQPDTITEIGA